jgi:hypothetical protein
VKESPVASANLSGDQIQNGSFFKQLAAWSSSYSRAFSEPINPMKTLLLSFCLIAATHLAAQDGLPLTPGATPPKTDSNSSAFLMGVLLSEAKPAKEDVEIFTKLYSALEKKDYASFVGDGEPAFRAFPEEQFDTVATQLAPKLVGDHQVTYLGVLQQKGFRVTLWKVSFKDGSDDMLATLSVRSGKVGGFFIR